MGFLPPNNFPINYLGRNSDGRTPFFSQADLYAQYRLSLGSRSALTFSANVINLFDQKTAVNYFATENYGAGVNGDQDAFYRGQLDFQTLQASAGRAHGRAVPEGGASAGGNGNGYQVVRSIRLGLKFSF